MAVDYTFYAGIYGGRTIDQNDWCGLERRAAAQLARYKRIYTVTAPDEDPDAESMAICAMADAMQSFDLLLNGECGPVSGVGIGSVSVSYAAPGSNSLDVSAKGQARELYRCASLYLDIYRGVS